MDAKTELITKDEWDKIVKTIPGAEIFYSYDWLQTIEENTKAKFYPLRISDGGNTIALFPFFLEKIYGIKAIFSPPRKVGIPYLGYLLLDGGGKQHKKETTNKILIKEFVEYTKSLKASYILLQLHPNIQDVRHFKWNDMLCSPNYTYIVNLERSLEDIFESFKTELKKRIKKAEKSNLTFRPGNETEMMNVFDSYVDRYKSYGINYFPKNVFTNLYKKFSDNIKCFVVEENGQVVSGIILLCSNDTVIHWIGTTKADDNYVTDYTMWNVIKWAHENGYKKCDLLGANTERICRFKSKYSPYPKVYYQITNKGKIANLINKRMV